MTFPMGSSKVRLRKIAVLALAMLAMPAFAQVMTSSKPVAMLYLAIQPEKTVSVLLPADKDIHSFSLRMGDISQLQSASYFYWLGGINEPFLVSLAKRNANKTPWIDVGGQHAHAWLSEQQINLMTQRILKQEIHQYPQQQAVLEQRAGAFITAISTRMDYWRNRLQPYQKLPVLLGHDAFIVMLKDFGFSNAIVYRTGNSHGHVQAGMKEIIEIQKQLAKADIRCALEEPEVSFAALKKRYDSLRIDTLDPFGKSIELKAGAYLDFIDANAQAIERCLQ